MFGVDENLPGSQYAHYQRISPRLMMSQSEKSKHAFSRLIGESAKSMYQLALRFTRNESDAEDLVADTVEKAWKAFATLDDYSAFKPWALRILHNTFVSDYRKRKVRPKQLHYDQFENHSGGADEVVAYLLEQPPEFVVWWANPEREFANQLLRQDLEQALNQLPEVFRMTVVLVTMEGLTYDEAAEVLDVPPGTVRSRMKRGRTLLQKILWQHGKDAGLITGNINKEQHI